MKRALLSITLIILLLSACSPQAAATEEPGGAVEQPTQINTDLTPAQRIAISTLAQNLGITPDQINLVSTEAVEWADACLGVQTEGVSCAQVVTPGFKVILDVKGKQVEFHTNQDATVIRPATVALTWTRTGGVAGFCDKLTIFLSGEVQGTNCKNSQMVEKRLSDLLTAEEIATLNEWVSQFGHVSIDASDPQGVADAMSVKVELFGTGSEQMNSQQLQQAILQFVQNLNQKLMGQ
jgi:hypothetical protein